MRTHVLEAAAPGDRTTIHTAHGDLTGSWRGRNPASAGAEIDVELSTTRAYDWAEIHPVPDGHPAFRIADDGQVEIRGEVVDYDESDVLTLRAGDTLLLVDTEGGAPVGITGTTVRIVLDDLQIYPTNV